MFLLGKIKYWFSKNKKYILLSGAVALTMIGTGVGYVLYKNSKISFPDWLKGAPKEELEELYEKMRLDFCKTGTKPFGMERIGYELEERAAKEWFKKHPPNLDPTFRWTDINRWDKD